MTMDITYLLSEIEQRKQTILVALGLGPMTMDITYLLSEIEQRKQTILVALGLGLDPSPAEKRLAEESTE